MPNEVPPVPCITQRVLQDTHRKEGTMRWSLTGLRGPGSSIVVDWSRANLYTCGQNRVVNQGKMRKTEAGAQGGQR